MIEQVDLFGEPGKNDEDNISGSRQQKASTSQAEQHLHALLATDSGYASLDHNKKTGSIGVDLEKTRMETSDYQATIPEMSREDLPYPSLDEDHDQVDDTGSIYTNGPSISSLKHENYISTLVEDLLGGVLPDKDYQEDLQRLQIVLPRLLKTFATKFGRLGSSQMHRNIMIFIRRRRT